ncbi:MAG: hypothetical protein H0W21_06450 [Actinobacteria bacterium]|nr:hypothetical protein [Actinomycetota bacterium]
MLATLAFAAAVSLAGMFAWAAAAKAIWPAGWRGAVGGFGLGRRAEPLVSVAVPVVELGVALTILWGGARAGAALALALLAAFSAAVVRARSLQGDRLPCGCFGRATVRDYRMMLARNVLGGGLAAVVLLAGAREGILEGSVAPSGPELMPAALTCLGTVLAGWTLWRAGGLRRRGRR